MGNYLRSLSRYIRGFTLIELLVIVIIIGILASLAMPMFTKSIERAREGEARTNLLLIYSSEKMYKFDNPPYTFTNSWDDLNNYMDNPNTTAKYYDFVLVGANKTDFLSRATRDNDPTKHLHIEEDGNVEDGPGTWP